MNLRVSINLSLQYTHTHHYREREDYVLTDKPYSTTRGHAAVQQQQSTCQFAN